MTAAMHWLDTAARVLCCEWVDRRGRDGWCETHDDPWPCGRAQEAAEVLAEELDQPTKEQKMSNEIRLTPREVDQVEAALDTPTLIDPADIRALERVRAMVKFWEDELESRCPSCRTDVFSVCDHMEGYHHALSDMRKALADPDAEAVEALAKVMHDDRCSVECCDGCDMGDYEHDAERIIHSARDRGWDVVRRAES